MSLLPTLTSMGITRFDQISRYTLYNDGAEEVLKIYYQRPEGSPLPRTKKFQFTQANSSSELLLQAVNELNTLASGDKGIDQNKQILTTELDQFEQVMVAKMDELRRRLEQWH
ncbi:MAG: DUF3461 family protein [Halopseudomonas sp.]